jgi:ATP-dependent DNA ligase
MLATAGPGIVINAAIDGEERDGATVFEHACRLGLEGIVSKRKDSQRRARRGRGPCAGSA